MKVILGYISNMLTCHNVYVLDSVQVILQLVGLTTYIINNTKNFIFHSLLFLIRITVNFSLVLKKDTGTSFFALKLFSH